MKNRNYKRISKIVLSLLCGCCSVYAFAAKEETPSITSIKLSGHIGRRIDDCIEKRVKSQDVDHLIHPFTLKNETSLWQSEFWGKWILGAIHSYRYKHDEELGKKIDYAVDELLKTQLSNGYIGNYSENAQLEGWDIWGRKYTLLGLLAYYDLTGKAKALTAGKKMIDHLMTQVGPHTKNIVKTGAYRGMPSSSILEPLMYLYRQTHEKRYLDFAQYIVAQWETPDGPQLISKALNDIPVAKRFSFPSSWWSWENGHKAYEMMSCYEGLIELYKETKEPLYLEAVEKSIRHIIDEEITIAGSGSAFECWYGGKQLQTYPTYHTMETCVTFTWMKLCNTMLQLTDNTLYADQIERTIYNALLAALKDDASQIVKYSPLEGRRSPGEEQCSMHINCCNANGPRGFALIPEYACQLRRNTIYINFYNASETTIALHKKQQIKITQTTDYPVNGKIIIRIDPSSPVRYPIALRIPSWSKEVTLAINGEKIKQVAAGSYHTVERTWKNGDQIELTLDLRAHVEEMNRTQAIVRGPIVLARDSRFADGDVDEAAVIHQKEGEVMLQEVKEKEDFAWMVFTAPLVSGTDLEAQEGIRQIRFCDFSSAGNNWDRKVRYRVWIPKTLNVMNADYHKY